MSKPVSYECIADDLGGIAVITIDNPPVNASGHKVREGLLNAIKRFAADGSANVAILVGAGKTFIAGADIREFGKPLKAPDLALVINEIENVDKPIICSIHGTALGGGLEIALACHYRVALQSTRVGLPEVHLGLLPGAGGTQRLPRLTGVEVAADIISTGRQVQAAEALDIGIIDHVDPGTDAQIAGLTFAQKVLCEKLPVRRTRDIHDKIDADRNNTTLFKHLLDVATKTARGQLSPVACVESVISATELPFDDGLVHARERFDTLIETTQSKSLIHMFFADRHVSKIPEQETGNARTLNAVAVIGGGTMGSGIAVSLLYAGLPVTMIERDAESAQRGRSNVENMLEDGVKRGKISSVQRNHLADTLYAVSTDISAVASADVVIEAAFENMNVKKELFVQIDKHAKDGAILASNTSFLDINEIAAVTKRPDHVLGLHFFSPAHIMKLLEVVVTDNTHPDVVVSGFSLAKRLQKVGVRAGVCDGFIGNRILDRYLNLVSNLVEDGTSPYDIDKTVTDFGFPMGPHQMLDLAGLDIVYANRQRKIADRWTGRYSATYMDQITELERFGQKSGRGLYLYEQGKRGGTPDPEVLTIISAVQAEKNIVPKALAPDAIMRRYMAAMINESANIVHEGIALRPLDVDVTMVHGYGFPRWRGGPLKYADLVGLDVILNDIRSFHDEDPEFWTPAHLLLDLVESGKNFDSLNKTVPK